jgi:hypothetical protein
MSSLNALTLHVIAGHESRAVKSVLQATANGDTPDDGLVAVKVSPEYYVKLIDFLPFFMGH